MFSLRLFRHSHIIKLPSMAGVNRPVTTSNYPVHHDPQNGKFYIQLDSKNKAILEYSLEDGVMDMYHTEVPPHYQGRGLAGLLAKAAFDRAVTDDCRMRLTCTYLQKYFNNHRLVEYEKLVI